MTITDHEIALARRIARRSASKWSLVEYDDLASELVLWLFEHGDTVTRYREAEAEGKLFVALRRQASKYCARVQAERSGGALATDSQWTTGQIQRALPFIFEDIPQSLVQTVAYRGDNGEPFEVPLNYSGTHSEALALVTDLRAAFYEMPEEVKETITLHFRDGMSFAEMGRLTGLTREASRKRVQRAVTRLRAFLDGIGSE